MAERSSFRWSKSCSPWKNFSTPFSKMSILSRNSYSKRCPSLQRRALMKNCGRHSPPTATKPKDTLSALRKCSMPSAKSPRGKTCDAILGIIAEGQEIMDEVDDEALRDAGILAAAQAAEPEIARYGTLRAWAELLGQEEAVELLSETLAEEKHADELLTSIADGGVNESATERPLAAE